MYSNFDVRLDLSDALSLPYIMATVNASLCIADEKLTSFLEVKLRVGVTHLGVAHAWT